MKAVGPRYVLSFGCIGDQCEETCCRGWTVPIDKETKRRLKALAPRGSKVGRWLASGIPGKGEGATLRQDGDGNCAFLEGGLCGLQTRWGDSHLPAGCATYPRRYSVVGQHLEVVGSLSCPEMARRCLLEDEAMEIVEIDLGARPRMLMNQLPKEEGNPYVQVFDTVRQGLLETVAGTSGSIGYRLFLLAFAANQMGGFYHRGCAALTPGRIAAQFATLFRPQAQAELASAYRQVELLSTTPLAVVASALWSRARGSGTQGFKRLMRDIWRGYGLEFDAPLDDVALAQLWASYRLRRTVLTERHGDRIERYVTQYALNFLLGELHTDHPDLSSYVRDLILRVAMLRFLVIGHPKCDDANETSAAAALVSAIDAAAVDAFTCFSRSLEHAAELQAELRRQVHAKGLDTVAHLALFTKL